MSDKDVGDLIDFNNDLRRRQLEQFENEGGLAVPEEFVPQLKEGLETGEPLRGTPVILEEPTMAEQVMGQPPKLPPNAAAEVRQLVKLGVGMPPCDICKKDFVENDMIVSVKPTPEEEKLAHVICFHMARAATFEQMFNAAHMLLGATVASAGGTMRLGKRAFEIARERQYNLDISDGPNGSVYVRLQRPANASGIVIAQPGDVK